MPFSEDTVDQKKEHSGQAANEQKPAEITGEIGKGLRRAKKGKREGSNGRGPETKAASSIYPRELSPPSLLPSRHPQQAVSATPNGPSPARSPLLPGLNLGSVSPANLAAYRTNEWTKSVSYSPSPPNGPQAAHWSVSGSPPNVPSLYGNNLAAVSHASPSASPPNGNGNGVMVHGPDNFRNFAYHLQERPGRVRRTSMYSQYSPQQYGASPPLPHQPQPHFYGLPELELPTPPKHGLVAGAEGYFCGFDTLADSGHPASRNAETVLIMGWERGLDVCRVEKEKLDVIGRLEGLRGAVIGAKILPSTARSDPLARLRPLAALIIHGPAQEVYSSGDRTEFPGQGQDRTTKTEATHYQTTVEVYSLTARVRVATLLSCPPVPISRSRRGRLMPPPPTGELRIQADGCYIAIGSGISGEVWAYELSATSRETDCFRCIGKTWTTVHSSSSANSSRSSSVGDSDSQDGSHSSEPRPRNSPLFSLRGRWLAVVPPTAQSQRTFHAKASLADSLPKPPGLLSNTPHAQPNVTCEVESLEGESIFNRVAREVTQEAIRGAKWFAGQGMQAWQYYMKRSQPTVNQPGSYSGTSYSMDQALCEGPQDMQYFPPTHAQPSLPTQTSRLPTIVSVLDLRRLGVTHTHSAASIEGIATFPVPFGCSHISFSPSGLAILTASKKGDVQIVWDLLRMVHGKSPSISSDGRVTGGNSGNSLQSPKVREVARFTRLTIANIVDVVWDLPNGGSLAILTEKGTAHLFDLPTSAFQWPPPRRLVIPTTSSADGVEPTQGGASEPIDVRPGNTSAVSAAMKAVSDRAQPILNAARGHGSSITSITGFSGLSLGQAASVTGGKVVAAGLNKSLNAASGTMQNLRHAGENRLHLPGNPSQISMGSVRWIHRKEQRLLAVVGGGLLRVYDIVQRPRKKGEKRPQSVVGKAIEYVLPLLPEQLDSSPMPEEESDPPTGAQETTALSGYWVLSSPEGISELTGTTYAQPLSYAEIETNPPYQPFHTDRRVSLFVYGAPEHVVAGEPDLHVHADHSSSAQTLQHESAVTGTPCPWVFGEPIAATKLNLGSANDDSDNEEGAVLNGNVVSNADDVRQLLDRNEGEQLVITTRRKRGARGGSDNENFFEDDCEVLDFAEDRV